MTTVETNEQESQSLKLDVDAALDDLELEDKYKSKAMNSISSNTQKQSEKKESTVQRDAEGNIILNTLDEPITETIVRSLILKID